MTRRTVVVCATIAWAAAGIGIACGGSSNDTVAPPGTGADGSVPPPTPPTPPGPPPPANYVTAPAGAGKAYCDSTYGAIVAYFNRCCDATDQTTGQYKLAVGLFTVFGGLCTSVLEQSITNGRMVYDPALAAQCDSALAPLATATCGSDLTAVVNPLASGACTTAFAGAVAAGQKCAGPHECAAGLTCVGYALSTKDAGSVEGTCQTPPAIGQPCEAVALDGGGSVSMNFPFQSKQYCAPGAYCTSTSGGKCAAQKDAGGFCGDDQECTTAHCYMDKCDTFSKADANGGCLANGDCKSGLFCEKPDASGAGTCQAKKLAPAACGGGAFSSECKGRCDVPDGSTNGNCVSFCGSG